MAVHLLSARFQEPLLFTHPLGFCRLKRGPKKRKCPAESGTQTDDALDTEPEPDSARITPSPLKKHRITDGIMPNVVVSSQQATQFVQKFLCELLSGIAVPMMAQALPTQGDGRSVADCVCSSLCPAVASRCACAVTVGIGRRPCHHACSFLIHMKCADGLPVGMGSLSALRDLHEFNAMLERFVFNCTFNDHNSSAVYLLTLLTESIQSYQNLIHLAVCLQRRRSAHFD